MNMQQAQITQLTAQLQQNFQQFLDSQAAAAASSPGVATQQNPRILEAKGLNKPKEFDGQEKSWSEFAFKFENWPVSVSPNCREMMRWAEGEDTTIVIEYLEAPDTLRTEEEIELNRDMYLALAQLVSGEVLTLVRNVEQNNGWMHGEG